MKNRELSLFGLSAHTSHRWITECTSMHQERAQGTNDYKIPENNCKVTSKYHKLLLIDNEEIQNGHMCGIHVSQVAAWP